MLARFRSLWRNLVRRRRADRALHDEVKGLFDMLVEEHIAAGLDPAEARRAATLTLGSVQSNTMQVREERAGALWDALVLDVRCGLRLLARSPLFSTFVVSSLALGIGATAAIFSLFDSIVLRKLPVPEPDRLVVASFGQSGRSFNYSLPFPHFVAIAERNSTMSGWFAMNPFGRVTVGIRGDPEVAQGVYVTGDYYRTLQLQPAAGRLLDARDDRPGQAVAVLNHAYWRRRCGGRPDAIGTTITVNQVPFVVVGVEPDGFYGTEVGRPYDVAVPMRSRDLLDEGGPLWDEAFATWIYMMGRLKPGVTIDRAEAELKEIFAQVSVDAARNPNQERLARENHLKLEPAATGNASDLRRGYDRWLRLLLMMLGAVLLLASLNVATLLLSRSDARQREIATRLALGADRRRVVRQFVTESLVLAGIAGAAGVALASSGSRALLRIATPAAERLTVDLRPDLRLIAFTLLISVVTCLIFGLLPAIRATSPKRLAGAREVGGGRQRKLLDRMLVASQMGLALVLLVAAGLFLRTLGNLWAQDTGYDRKNVLMFSVDARLAGKKGAEVPATYQRLLDDLRRLPGAQAVALSAVRPVSDNYYFVTSFREIGGRVLSADDRVRVAFNDVAPGYFATLGIPLLIGRDFNDGDSAASPRVAIVSERMARHFTGNPVGQRLGSGPNSVEVVGVVRDIRYANVKDAPREVVYFPMFQKPPQNLFYSPTYEIRHAAGPGADLLQSIRQTATRVEPALTMFRVRTLEEQTDDSLSRERLLALLSTYFGAFAVLLACIGLYGLMSYTVTRRTPEIGLRMALGAHPHRVRRLIVGEAAVTVAAGAMAGSVAAFWATRVVESQLFGVERHDPIAVGGAIALLFVMALGAAYLPARRASRIDPLTALRHD